MTLLLEALNHPAAAFRRGKALVPCILVGAAVLINSIFEPVLQLLCSSSSPALSAVRMLKITALGVLSYLVFCAAFWLVCKCFGSKRAYQEHLKAWGVTFFPTALCSIVVSATEVFFYVFWNSTVWGMLLNFVFIGILIWKAMLYLIYLSAFAELKSWRFVGAAILMGIIILLMAAADGYLGIKTPMI